MDQADHKVARDFFSLYRLEPLDNSAFLLTSSKEQMLVRTHLIDPHDNETIQEVLNLLDMHLSLDQQYIAPLLHFEQCQDGVRAFYKMDRLTLRQDVQTRFEEKRYFRQEELWVLLSSLVDSLLYLQQKGVIYGVLSSSKIFLEDQIRLMDPSAYNLAPMNVSRLSYHSPQIKQSSNNIDFNISDVYLLGLSLLQAASLISIPKSINKQVQDRMLQDITSRYSTQLIHVLRHMLEENPSSRPTFKDIKEYIESEIQISGSKQWPAQSLAADTEDQIGNSPNIFIEELGQMIDTLQPSDEPKHDRKISEYEKARDQFLQSPLKLHSKILPATNQNSKQGTNSETKVSRKQRKTDQNSIVQEFKLQIPYTINKNKKVTRAVQIKNRNAEQVKKIESVRYQNVCGTNPFLMNMLQTERQKALQYMQVTQRLR